MLFDFKMLSINDKVKIMFLLFIQLSIIMKCYWNGLAVSYDKLFESEKIRY